MSDFRSARNLWCCYSLRSLTHISKQERMTDWTELELSFVVFVDKNSCYCHVFFRFSSINLFLTYNDSFHVHRLERSKVRVTFFQSIKPQQISPPADFEFHCFSNPLLDNLFISPADIGNNNMTAALMPDYKRNLRYGKLYFNYVEHWTHKRVWRR